MNSVGIPQRRNFMGINNKAALIELQDYIDVGDEICWWRFRSDRFDRMSPTQRIGHQLKSLTWHYRNITVARWQTRLFLSPMSREQVPQNVTNISNRHRSYWGQKWGLIESLLSIRTMCLWAHKWFIRGFWRVTSYNLGI